MKQEKLNEIPTVLSKMEQLKQLFPEYFDKEGNFLIEKFNKEINQNNIDISKETYSLEWLGKSYAKVLASEPVRTFLKENKKWNIQEKNKNSENLLIKGDNLEVLKHLIGTYENEIKMIYIDPPYNTGNDGFLYNDTRIFTITELQKLAGVSSEKAKRILNFVNSKSNSHSAWLTFMYPRLYIAKQLLKDDGVIFVSIDDNEVAQLKILMDEIFGEENFAAQLVWRKKAGGGNDSSDIAIEHEYILIYFKQEIINFKLPLKPETLNSYKYKDEKYNLLGPYKIKDLNDFSLSDSKGLHYDIITPDGSILKGEEHQWKCNYETFKKRLKNNRIIFKQNKNKIWKVYYKIYLNEEKGEIKKDDKGNILQKKRNPESILYSLTLNKDGNKRITELFKDGTIFKYSKPINLIQHFIKMINQNNFIVLDFFAGSGTTADAVMQLNAKDGGNRKFMLVQLPEPIDPKKNKTAYNFVKDELKIENPTIFNITKERIIRSAKKIIIDKEKEIEDIQNRISKINSKEKQTKKDKEKLIELENLLTKKETELKNISQLDLGFKEFETIPIPNKNLQNIDEIIEENLFEEITDTNALLTTWKIFDGIKLDEELKEMDFNGYKGYYLENNLYLVNKGFNLNNLASILEKIDEDINFIPSKIVINGYAFESKMQRELYESLNNYNKKDLNNIELIIRY